MMVVAEYAWRLAQQRAFPHLAPWPLHKFWKPWPRGVTGSTVSDHYYAIIDRMAKGEAP